MSSDEEPTTPEKKKFRAAPKHYDQKFQSKWLLDSKFKDWVQPVKLDSRKAYCKCCKIEIATPTSALLARHAATAKHAKNFLQAKSTTPKLDVFVKKTTETNTAAKAEVLLAGFFAEHHVPHTHADHLIDVLKKAFPDSEIVKKCSLKKTKMSYLVHEGLAHHEEKSLIEICRSHKFSILIDESTDTSVTQVLAVVVRYFDEEKQDVTDALLDSIEVEDGSAQGLYNSLKNMLTEKNIPLSNIIGFGSDNCSVMMDAQVAFRRS